MSLNLHVEGSSFPISFDDENSPSCLTFKCKNTQNNAVCGGCPNSGKCVTYGLPRFDMRAPATLVNCIYCTYTKNITQCRRLNKSPVILNFTLVVRRSDHNNGYWPWSQNVWTPLLIAIHLFRIFSSLIIKLLFCLQVSCRNLTEITSSQCNTGNIISSY